MFSFLWWQLLTHGMNDIEVKIFLYVKKNKNKVKIRVAKFCALDEKVLKYVFKGFHSCKGKPKKTKRRVG